MAEGKGLVGLPVTPQGIGNKPQLASAPISGGRRCFCDCSRPGLHRHPPAELSYLQPRTLELEKMDAAGASFGTKRNAFRDGTNAKADLQRERGNSPSAAQFW